MNILITGAASGIGRATVEIFICQGHNVYGIDISPMPDRENFHGFTADITDAASLLNIQEFFQSNGIMLDVILNIAGIHRMVALVESDYAQMKNMVDINLCGTMLVNRVFHPCLRSQGRILIITSEVAGFYPMPFNGLYNVTKTALESYAQALRQELNLIGQSVVTVRPGAVATPLSQGSVSDTKRLAETTELYAAQAGSFSRLASQFMGKPIKPEALAKLICKAATERRPRLTYIKHRNAGLVLLNTLPKRMQCALIKFLLQLKVFAS